MSGQFPARRVFTIELPRHGRLRLGDRPLVMGILNVTPDSFADASPRVVLSARIDRAQPIDGAQRTDRAQPSERAQTIDAVGAIQAALRMEADGADLIDIGGESTRPGAEPVSAADELARILPVVRGLAGRLRIPISVDTYKADVARAALEAGAAIINDVSGLRHEPALAAVVAQRGAALVLMHSRGQSKAMYSEAVYENLIGEISDELRASITTAAAGGVPIDQLIVDPGIGFAKRRAHSYGVLARLPELAVSLDRPVVVGPSRKSFLREASGARPSTERDWATAAAVTAAVLAGAHIIRVHAVAEMAQVMRVAEEIRRSV